MQRDVLDVLEAAYRLDVPDGEWVRGVAEAAAPLLDDGVGVQGFTVDLRKPARCLSDECLVGGEDPWRAQWRGNWWEPLMERIPTETMLAIAAFAPVSYASQVWHATALDIPTFDVLMRDFASGGFGHVLPDYADAAAGDSDHGRLFYPDSLNLVGLDPTGVGLLIVANRRARATDVPTTRMLQDGGRLAAHLATATRLRYRLGSGAPLDGAAAILDPEARIVHAEGPATTRHARATLRQATVDMDRARGARVVERERTFALWRTLHDARWSLVDVFDTDGRRYVVARENAPEVGSHRALTERELQVVALVGLGLSNKVIAYELGLAHSTVATLVGRARRKLGLGTTSALIRWARARCGPGRADPL